MREFYRIYLRFKILDISRFPEVPEDKGLPDIVAYFLDHCRQSVPGVCLMPIYLKLEFLRLQNTPECGGYGITLQPAEVSRFPNLKQLYALRIV